MAVLITPALALQQTGGELYINVTQGSFGSSQYGLKNEESTVIVVKLSASGEAANYLELPKELTLEPNQFFHIKVKAIIPSNYSGLKQLNGTIYALKEGEKGGQVQLNIRLGKNVKLAITEPEATKAMPKSTPFVSAVTIMGAIIILAGARIYKKRGGEKK